MEEILKILEMNKMYTWSTQTSDTQILRRKFIPTSTYITQEHSKPKISRWKEIK